MASECEMKKKKRKQFQTDLCNHNRTHTLTYSLTQSSIADGHKPIKRK